MPRSGADLINQCTRYHIKGKIQGCLSKFKDFFKDIPKFKIKFKDLSKISRIGIKFKDFKDFFKDVATLYSERIQQMNIMSINKMFSSNIGHTIYIKERKFRYSNFCVAQPTCFSMRGVLHVLKLLQITSPGNGLVLS